MKELYRGFQTFVEMKCSHLKNNILLLLLLFESQWSSISWFISHMPTGAFAETSWSQEPGAVPGVHMWVAGTEVLGLFSIASQALQQEAGSERAWFVDYEIAIIL